jgi:hypothetical protein
MLMHLSSQYLQVPDIPKILSQKKIFRLISKVQPHDYIHLLRKYTLKVRE